MPDFLTRLNEPPNITDPDLPTAPLQMGYDVAKGWIQQVVSAGKTQGKTPLFLRCIGGNDCQCTGMNPPKSNDPLHGITLERLLTELVDRHGWAELGDRIPVRCFLFDPSIKSSLKFLRKTPWARAKVEQLYLESLR
jgi:hypothetical protein